MQIVDVSKIITDITSMKKAYDAISLDGIIKALKEAPPVDAVPVVRCKDCINCVEIKLKSGKVYFHKCDFHDIEVDTDDFCSCGERKEET